MAEKERRRFGTRAEQAGKPDGAHKARPDEKEPPRQGFASLLVSSAGELFAGIKPTASGAITYRAREMVRTVEKDEEVYSAAIGGLDETVLEPAMAPGPPVVGRSLESRRLNTGTATHTSTVNRAKWQTCCPRDPFVLPGGDPPPVAGAPEGLEHTARFSGHVIEESW